MMNFWTRTQPHGVSIDLSHEAERNRVLRRADWRFLLPNLRPARSICFANDRLAQAVESISDRMVDTRMTPAGECDLAVAVDPDIATLRAIWFALRPGGSCYIEWYSPLAGGSNRIQRRLTALGFEAVTCYWAWPLPSRAASQFWLPIDAPGAVDDFLRHRVPGHGIARKAGFAARRSMWFLGARTGLLAPVFVVARKPAASTDPNADLLALIRSRWANWGFGPTPDQLYWLLLTGGKRSINKIVGLVSARRNDSPRLIAKMPRVPEAVAALKQEATILQALEAHHPHLRGVPRVLFRWEQDSHCVVGETILTGVPLYSRLSRGTYRALALKATDWLIDLAGRPERSPRTAGWHRRVETMPADFADRYGAVLDHDLLKKTRALLAVLGDLPPVCEQGDFSPWNVLIDARGNWGIHDWESAELHGLPAIDLIYFLTYLGFFLDGATESGRYRESYRNILNPSTLSGAVFDECMTHYAARVGLELADLKALRPLTWILHACSEHQNLTADAGGPPAPDTLRRSQFVGLWEEDMQHAG